MNVAIKKQCFRAINAKKSGKSWPETAGLNTVGDCRMSGGRCSHREDPLLDTPTPVRL